MNPDKSADWEGYIAMLERQRAHVIAEGKEKEAELLEETAEEPGEPDLRRAARAKRAAARQWRRGLGLGDGNRS